MRREWVYSLSILIGLPFSATGGFGLLEGTLAEWPVSIWCWSYFIWLFVKTGKRERIEMLMVIAFATPMELFFSEVWLIYEYQRGLMPLFVPVGHWFLFDLGRLLSHKVPSTWVWPALLLFTPLVIWGVVDGSDTSGLPLLIFVLAFTKFGPEPKLYATMVWLALLMEIWGTGWMNWTWANEVPWTPLTAWNPPLLVGAFYCLGDLLVNMTCDKLAPENPGVVAEIQ